MKLMAGTAGSLQMWLHQPDASCSTCCRAISGLVLQGPHVQQRQVRLRMQTCEAAVISGYLGSLGLRRRSSTSQKSVPIHHAGTAFQQADEDAGWLGWLRICRHGSTSRSTLCMQREDCMRLQCARAVCGALYVGKGVWLNVWVAAAATLSRKAASRHRHEPIRKQT